MLIYLGIGTNLGDREANLREALRWLDEWVGERLACSSVYRSAPQGFVSNNEFSPEEILLLTQQIERDMGRAEKSVNGVYHDRVIDIDLLQAYIGTQESGVGRPIEYSGERLTLPHPRMQERDFVMIPLREVEDMLMLCENS